MRRVDLREHGAEVVAEARGDGVVVLVQEPCAQLGRGVDHDAAVGRPRRARLLLHVADVVGHPEGAAGGRDRVEAVPRERRLALYEEGADGVLPVVDLAQRRRGLAGQARRQRGGDGRRHGQDGGGRP